MIVSAGYNIAPAQVENILSEHPDVLEVACVGAPDPTEARSAIVKAFVALRPGSKESEGLKAELQKFVRDHATPYMYPREVEFLPELPKTLTGKIRRSELKQRAWENGAPVQDGERGVS